MIGPFMTAQNTVIGTRRSNIALTPNVDTSVSSLLLLVAADCAKKGSKTTARAPMMTVSGILTTLSAYPSAAIDPGPRDDAIARSTKSVPNVAIAPIVIGTAER